MRSSSGLLLSLLLALLLPLSGCLELERLELQLAGGQGGQLVLERVLRVPPGLRAQEAVVDELACWQGVTAWTSISAVVSGGRLRYQARGRFERLSEL
ncbi:MAG TPA: hypothetical protein DEA08_13510, partial [Planctomycetes bacterium]|nr:hypothetical protein [Planctomycetota bacterium]